ncbi:MAG TPA: hypothetical protein VF595_10575 [Tepidisphaeraceae bacterium]|jgi:hypothetical protein
MNIDERIVEFLNVLQREHQDDVVALAVVTKAGGKFYSSAAHQKLFDSGVVCGQVIAQASQAIATTVNSLHKKYDTDTAGVFLAGAAAGVASSANESTGYVKAEMARDR